MRARIWTHSFWIPDERVDVLDRMFTLMLTDAGFEIVDKVRHAFEPQGESLIYVLAESHFAIHTFPEEQRAWCEIASCNLADFNLFLTIVEDRIGHLIV